MLPRVELTPDILKEELARLESAYHMTSAEFYERFQAGTIPEGGDVVRWVWLCTVAMRQGTLVPTSVHA